MIILFYVLHVTASIRLLEIGYFLLPNPHTGLMVRTHTNDEPRELLLYPLQVLIEFVGCV